MLTCSAKVEMFQIPLIKAVRFPYFTTFKCLYSVSIFSSSIHAILHCLLFLFICSDNIFHNIAYSVDCVSGTATREGKKEGIGGEGRGIDGGNMPVTWIFKSFSRRNPKPETTPLLPKNALIKLTYGKVETNSVSGAVALPPDPPASAAPGEKDSKEGRMNKRKRYGPPHLFIQVYAYGVICEMYL